MLPATLLRGTLQEKLVIPVIVDIVRLLTNKLIFTFLIFDVQVVNSQRVYG